YRIVTLDDGVLGLTEVGGSVVTLDATAAGYGWFVDAAPADNSAFAFLVTPLELRAGPDSLAFGRMDLLAVVERELGDVHGLEGLDPQAVPHNLMPQTLATGVRRLPALFLGPLAPAATLEAPPAPLALDGPSASLVFTPLGDAGGPAETPAASMVVAAPGDVGSQVPDGSLPSRHPDVMAQALSHS